MRELWAELSASMRALRQNAGMSLRKVETESGVGRGTLSQYENAKARPNRRILEWYDQALGGDGLLLSLFAEARGAHGPASPRDLRRVVAPGDEMDVVFAEPVFGSIVIPGAAVTARWTLRNVGTVPWRERRLERIGARAGQRVIASSAGIAVPDCEPGDKAECETELRVPDVAATYAAHWHMTDRDGRVVLPFDQALSVQLVVLQH